MNLFCRLNNRAGRCCVGLLIYTSVNYLHNVYLMGIKHVKFVIERIIATFHRNQYVFNKL